LSGGACGLSPAAIGLPARGPWGTAECARAGGAEVVTGGVLLATTGATAGGSFAELAVAECGGATTSGVGCSAGAVVSAPWRSASATPPSPS
jgi:hypothetical protein